MQHSEALESVRLYRLRLGEWRMENGEWSFEGQGRSLRNYSHLGHLDIPSYHIIQ